MLHLYYIKRQKYEKTLQCKKPEEVKACCCVDVGTIIDNSDLTVDFHNPMQPKRKPKALEYLTQKARAAEVSLVKLKVKLRR